MHFIFAMNVQNNYDLKTYVAKFSFTTTVSQGQDEKWSKIFDICFVMISQVNVFMQEINRQKFCVTILQTSNAATVWNGN